MEHLNSIVFSNQNNGFAVGNKGSLVKSTNGGSTWSLMNINTSSNLTDICFPDELIGYIIGHSGVIKKTTDGGNTWLDINIDNSSFYYSIYFVNVDTGYIAGANGLVIKTTNGGSTWTQLNTNTSNWLFSVKFINNTGYAVGDAGELIKSNDGGETWSKINSSTINPLYCVYFNDTNRVYFSGYNGTILTNSKDLLVSKLLMSSNDNKIKIYPNPVFNNIHIECNDIDYRKINIELYSINNILLKQKEFQECKILDINLSDLPIGIYILKIYNGNLLKTKKIIKVN